jgi:hypothetical protein
MRWFVLAVIVVIATFFLGVTAIDKYDENHCKDRANTGALERHCRGLARLNQVGNWGVVA